MGHRRYIEPLGSARGATIGALTNLKKLREAVVAADAYRRSVIGSIRKKNRAQRIDQIDVRKISLAQRLLL
jgi:hypothetical protein